MPLPALTPSLPVPVNCGSFLTLLSSPKRRNQRANKKPENKVSFSVTKQHSNEEKRLKSHTDQDPNPNSTTDVGPVRTGLGQLNNFDIQSSDQYNVLAMCLRRPHSDPSLAETLPHEEFPGLTGVCLSGSQASPCQELSPESLPKLPCFYMLAKSLLILFMIRQPTDVHTLNCMA